MNERLAETAAKARVALGGDATVEDVLHLFRSADHSVRDTHRVLVWDKPEKPLPVARPWETVLTLWRKVEETVGVALIL